MRNFIVVFEVFKQDWIPNGSKEVEYVKINVEAGNKKIAAMRAIQELNKKNGYSDKYKNIKSIEEVA